MSNSINAFVLRLIKIVANLNCLYDEHIEDYDELIPHVFFGDLTRYVVDLYKSILDCSSDTKRWDELDTILVYLENGISGNDEKVQELIAVSFLENLDLTDSNARTLVERFGPYLKKELKMIRGE
ncbi:MAG: hypothetical protein KKD44_02625 [Proteobacteria bacterium]|nr:hypothetical protein [Pseudomonadota bacterium]